MDVTTFLGLSLLPILSPGPSSILAVRNSQRHGLPFALQRLCADGVATLMTASLLLYGLGAVIADNPPLLLAIQLLGASYVLLVGVLCIRRMGRSAGALAGGAPRGGWLEAFLAGLLNPKTLVFFALMFQPLLGDDDFHTALPFLYSLGYSLFKIAALALACGVLLLAREWVHRRQRLAHGLLGTALVATGSGFLVKVSSALLG